MKLFGKFSLSDLFYNKKFILPFSIIFAFVFWLVITVDQTPIRESTISLTVNVAVEGTIVGDMGMDAVSGGIGQRVDVRVSGPSYILSELKESDIYVSPSLSDVNQPGEYVLKLTPMRASSKAGYEFLSVTPSSLTVRFDYVDTKDFLITPNVKGAVASEGLIAEAAAISNSGENTISIKGPRTEMSKISSVVASAQVNKTLSKTESFDADILLLDEQGRELDKSIFTLSFDKVKVSVPISKKKTVPLKATFVNAPLTIGKDISYSISHDSVSVIGPPETIDSLNVIELSPVDFNNVTVGKTSFDMAPVLPDGVRILDNIEAVTVSFNLRGYTERTFTVSSYNCVNNESGLVGNVSEAIKNVKICGPSSVMRSLDNASFRAQIDLSGKSAGEYTVPVKIYCAKSNAVWQVGTYTAVVVVSEDKSK